MLASIHDANEAIGVGSDGVNDAGEGGRGSGIGSSADGWDQIAEERKRERSDSDGALLLPDDDRIVELLGRSESRQVPRVTVVVDILGVSADGNGLALGDASVDAIDGSERVDNGLVVGQGLVAAGLESVGVTADRGVKVVNRSQNRGGIPAVTVAASVDCSLLVSGLAACRKPAETYCWRQQSHCCSRTAG